MSMVQPTAAETQFAKQAWLRALQRVASIDQNPDLILPVLIDRVAERYPSSMALVSPVDSLSYLQLAQRCRQYARWGISQGLKPGDSVCLAMANCAEYLAVWLGLSHIGVIVALANTQLSSELLTHAIEVAAPRLVIAGTDQASVLAGARPALSGDLPCWVRGPSIEGLSSIDEALLGQSSDPDSHCALPPLDATALFIYTSGTTGLPKAARVSHRRVMQWSLWFAGMLDTRPEDRMYDCLPLYHSVGGVVATGATLVARRHRDHPRAILGVGLLARHLARSAAPCSSTSASCADISVNAPHQDIETDHSLRIACGNGLRPEVWEDVSERASGFRASSSTTRRPKAHSRCTTAKENRARSGGSRHFCAIKCRLSCCVSMLDTGQPRRDASGFCQRCGVDEVGEAVGMGRFEGYADIEASERKMLRRRFRRGRRMVPDRRSYAPRRARVLSLRRSGRRYVSLEGGECFHIRGAIGDFDRAGSDRCDRVWGDRAEADGRAGMAALIVDGHVRRRTFQTGHRATSARRTRDRCSCAFCRAFKQPARSNPSNGTCCTRASIPR